MEYGVNGNWTKKTPEPCFLKKNMQSFLLSDTVPVFKNSNASERSHSWFLYQWHTLPFSPPLLARQSFLDTPLYSRAEHPTTRAQNLPLYLDTSIVYGCSATRIESAWYHNRRTDHSNNIKLTAEKEEHERTWYHDKRTINKNEGEL